MARLGGPRRRAFTTRGQLERPPRVLGQLRPDRRLRRRLPPYARLRLRLPALRRRRWAGTAAAWAACRLVALGVELVEELAALAVAIPREQQVLLGAGEA